MSAEAPAPEDVFEAMHAFMHRYRAEQYRAMQRGQVDLAHVQGKVLAFFARHPGATQKELAGHSGRDKGQLARLIAELKQRGLLEGAVDEADRRSVRLRLTAEGQRVHLALHRRARALAEQAVARITVDERRQFIALIGKLTEGLPGPD